MAFVGANLLDTGEKGLEVEGDVEMQPTVHATDVAEPPVAVTGADIGADQNDVPVNLPLSALVASRTDALDVATTVVEAENSSVTLSDPSINIRFQRLEQRLEQRLQQRLQQISEQKEQRLQQRFVELDICLQRIETLENYNGELESRVSELQKAVRQKNYGSQKIFPEQNV